MPLHQQADTYGTKAVYERDLTTMKQHNINAIRTSHYPQDEVFLHPLRPARNLCDGRVQCGKSWCTG